MEPHYAFNHALNNAYILSQSFLSHFAVITDKENKLKQICELVEGAILRKYRDDWKQTITRQVSELSSGLKQRSREKLQALASTFLEDRFDFLQSSESFDGYFTSSFEQLRRAEHSPELLEEFKKFQSVCKPIFEKLNTCHALVDDLKALSILDITKTEVKGQLKNVCETITRIREQHLQELRETDVELKNIEAHDVDEDFLDSELSSSGDQAYVELLNSVRDTLVTLPNIINAFLSLNGDIREGNLGDGIMITLDDYLSEVFQEHRILTLILCYALLKLKDPSIALGIDSQLIEHMDLSILSRLHNPEQLTDLEREFVSQISKRSSDYHFTRQHYTSLGWIYKQSRKINPLPFTSAILSCVKRNKQAFIQNWEAIKDGDYRKNLHAFAFGMVVFGDQLEDYLEHFDVKFRNHHLIFVAKQCALYAPRLAHDCLTKGIENIPLADLNHIMCQIIKGAAQRDVELYIDLLEVASKYVASSLCGLFEITEDDRPKVDELKAALESKEGCDNMAKVILSNMIPDEKTLEKAITLLFANEFTSYLLVFQKLRMSSEFDGNFEFLFKFNQNTPDYAQRNNLCIALAALEVDSDFFSGIVKEPDLNSHEKELYQEFQRLQLILEALRIPQKHDLKSAQIAIGQLEQNGSCLMMQKELICVALIQRRIDLVVELLKLMSMDERTEVLHYFFQMKSRWIVSNLLQNLTKPTEKRTIYEMMRCMIFPDPEVQAMFEKTNLKVPNQIWVAIINEMLGIIGFDEARVDAESLHNIDALAQLLEWIMCGEDSFEESKFEQLKQCLQTDVLVQLQIPADTVTNQETFSADKWLCTIAIAECIKQHPRPNHFWTAIHMKLMDMCIEEGATKFLEQLMFKVCAFITDPNILNTLARVVAQENGQFEAYLKNIADCLKKIEK